MRMVLEASWNWASDGYGEWCHCYRMSVEGTEPPINERRTNDEERRNTVQKQNDMRRTTCFGYGRLSAAKRDLTEAAHVSRRA